MWNEERNSETLMEYDTQKIIINYSNKCKWIGGENLSNAKRTITTKMGE